MKIAVITGSRDWSTYGDIANDLKTFDPDLVVHGNCPRGADRMAEDWAKANGINIRHFNANWKYDGKRAGMLRNGEMISWASNMAAGKHQIKVFAYRLNSSPGTSDCIRKSKQYNLETVIRDMVSK